MDFDLFELAEDDDVLLTSVCLEPTQHANGQQQTEALVTNNDSDNLPELQCSGEDSLHSQFSSDGFIKSGFMLSQAEQTWHKLATELTLSDYDFGAAHLRENATLQFVCGTACMHVQHLWASIRQPVSTPDALTHYQRRRQVTQLLYLVLHSTHVEQWPLLRTALSSLRQLLDRVTELDTWKLVYFANSCKGNDCNAVAYHFLHGAFEWKLLDLCILQKFENSALKASNFEAVAQPSCMLLQQIERLCLDLINCTLCLYAKKRPVELLYCSPFPCTCIKECWLFLQFATERWFGEAESATGEKVTFWRLYNEAFAKIKSHIDKYALTALRLVECSNWLLHALVRLFGYRSNGQFEGPGYKRSIIESADNYQYCESNTQQFLAANPSEEQLRAYNCLLMPTLLQWWRPHVGIPILLWEYFHKRLNASFYVAGAAPSNLAVACNSGKAYVERYRALLMQPQPQDANLCSYTLFTILLGKNLQRLLEEAHARHQAQKLLGRIYTKFSAQKFLALNETGIHHLIELFLALMLCGDFEDVAPKVCAKLLSIALDKITASRQIAVTKGHMALLILYAERRCELGDYVTKLLEQLASVHNDLAVSKVIADGLLDIFVHADDFRRGEHLLIDAWLPNFLNNCTPVEQDRSLEALHLIFAKLQRAEGHIESDLELFKALNAHVLPFLKQQFISGFSQWLPQLAVDFCAHSSTVPDTQSFQKLFRFFIEAPTLNRQALPQFLRKVLQTERGALVEGNIVIHVWLKSLVQLTATNEDVAQLTRCIVELPEFKLMTELEAADLLQAKEPLCVFIAAVGKTYDAHPHDHQRRLRIADALNVYLRNFERWLHADLKQENMELAFRFYSFLAIVIYNCPHIVYTKSRVSSFFHTVIARFALPVNVQMGKPPEGKLAQLVHKIWPVLVQGIGRLNFKHDPYLNKTLTDLIQKWTPHFKISPNSKVVARPFITCLQGDNTPLSLFVFEKLTSLFLATQRRQADPNACLVVTIFQEVVDAVACAADAVCEQRLETFMKGTSLLMLEHIMMVDEVVPSRALLLDLFKRICNSATYRQSSQLQALLTEHLRLLTKKHLAYYTFFYFDLLMKLAQISAVTVRQIMDFLLAEVRIVEQKRGAGEDNRIRGCVQKLQQALK